MPGSSESQLTDGIMKGCGGQLLLSGRELSPLQQVCGTDTNILRAWLCATIACKGFWDLCQTPKPQGESLLN